MKSHCSDYQSENGLVERRRVVEAMREPFRDVPPEEIERETARVLAETREEIRQERRKASGNEMEHTSHIP